MRITQETVDALTTALKEQRRAGVAPIPALQDAIVSLAGEARDKGIPPETLLVQLKRIAADAGLEPNFGDDVRSSLREWIVTACVSAYYRAKGE